MTDNKDLKYTKQFTPEPFIPNTETRITFEQQDLYPDLGYEDVSSDGGFAMEDKEFECLFKNIFYDTIFGFGCI
ncbi:14118_t:CDS:2 [Funneliformis geosporum]|nr:14118_t:CDS:2 [Funneliformis geosporum]